MAAGRVKGRIEVVEDFRRAGVTWDVIDAATGLVQAGFELLKVQSSERADSLLFTDHPARAGVHGFSRDRRLQRGSPTVAERRALPLISGSLADCYTDKLAQPAQGVVDR